MHQGEKERRGPSQKEVEKTFRALRLDGLRRNEGDEFCPSPDGFGLLRHVSVTADNVTRPISKDPPNA